MLAKPNRTPCRSRGARRDGGVALILVLLFVTLLTVLIVEFAYETEVNASQTVNAGSNFEALVAARSAIAIGMGDLAQDLITEEIDPPPGWGGAQVDSQRWEAWGQGRPFEPLNNAQMRVAIDDEFAKLNLNALIVYPTGVPEENVPLTSALLYILDGRTDGNGQALIDGLMDWLDYNDEDSERPDGAENDYYTGLENPYPCKTGPRDSLDELLLIKGFTPEVFYGDPELEPPQVPLTELLTVHGDWNGRVNVNSAEIELLDALAFGYADVGIEIDVDGILTEFEEGPFTELAQVRSFVRAQPQDDSEQGGNQQNQQQRRQQAANQATATVFMIHSHAFRIYGDARLNDQRVRIETFVWRLPLDPQLVIEPPPRGLPQGFDVPPPPVEPFRILASRVIS